MFFAGGTIAEWIAYFLLDAAALGSNYNSGVFSDVAYLIDSALLRASGWWKA